MFFKKYKSVFMIIVILIMVFLYYIYFYNNREVVGVQSYGTIKIGINSPIKEEYVLGSGKPGTTVPKADFYVYSVGDEFMCLGIYCGYKGEGKLVDCLGGWLLGEKKVTKEEDYGLSDVGIDVNKHPIITVANKDGIIVGIYPETRVVDVPKILEKHKDLFEGKDLKKCTGF